MYQAQINYTEKLQQIALNFFQWFNLDVEAFHTFILIIHVLGAALIIGVAFSSLVIQLRKPSPENMKMVEALFKTIQIVFVTQLLSGLYLGWSEYDEFKGNPLLWIKFLLFVGVAIVAGVILRREKQKAKASGSDIIGPNIAWAWVSLLIVLLIATFGVMLAESVG